MESNDGSSKKESKENARNQKQRMSLIDSSIDSTQLMKESMNLKIGQKKLLRLNCREREREKKKNVKHIETE